MRHTLSKQLVAALPDAPALLLMRMLASRTQRPPVNDTQQAAMAHAHRLRYGAAGRNTAWRWGEHGPIVLLAHGWNGRAAQLAPLAHALSLHGYRCVAIDVTGHGDSAGSRTAWRCFLDDIASLARTLRNEQGEELHACIGHSAGGLAMMGARHRHGLTASHFVCICAPTHPHPPIRAIRQRLDPRPSLIVRYQQFIASQFGTDWQALEAGHAYAGTGRELLLVYDRGDRFVDPADGARIHAWCPGSTFIQPTSVGHSRVLQSAELHGAVLAFLNAPRSALGRAVQPVAFLDVGGQAL